MYFVAPVLSRGWDHVKKAGHTRIARTVRLYACDYTRIHKALKDSEETTNSKSCLTYCAVLFVL